jgi:hypothetical protein
MRSCAYLQSQRCHGADALRTATPPANRWPFCLDTALRSPLPSLRPRLRARQISRLLGEIMFRAVLCAAALMAASVGLAPAALAERPYANCTEAHQEGVYDIPQSDDAYWSGGDRDGDGVACES